MHRDSTRGGPRIYRAKRSSLRSDPTVGTLGSRRTSLVAHWVLGMSCDAEFSFTTSPRTERAADAPSVSPPPAPHSSPGAPGATSAVLFARPSARRGCCPLSHGRPAPRPPFSVSRPDANRRSCLGPARTWRLYPLGPDAPEPSLLASRPTPSQTSSGSRCPLRWGYRRRVSAIAGDDFPTTKPSSRSTSKYVSS